MQQLLSLLIITAGLLPPMAKAQNYATALRLAIVGLVHGHVPGFLEGSLSRADIRLVAIVEADRQLAAQYAARYHVDSALLFTDLEGDAASKVKPEAVATFTSTFDHRKVVEVVRPPRRPCHDGKTAGRLHGPCACHGERPSPKGVSTSS